MNNAKEFGIYTDNANVFVVLYTNKTTSLGFAIPIYRFYDNTLTNELINDWINGWLNHINKLETGDIFKVDNRKSNLMKNWGYLGQVQDVNDYDEIRTRIVEMMNGKTYEWLNKE